MPTVWIPSPMQVYTQGLETVEADGANVRQLIFALEYAFPGMQAALMDGDKLRPDVAVAIDGQVAPMGLLQTLTDNNEVTFIPAIAGGQLCARQYHRGRVPEAW